MPAPQHDRRSLDMLPYFPADDPLAQQQYTHSGTTRLELLRMMNTDMHALLSSGQQFQEYITQDTSLKRFLSSYLQYRSRPFDSERVLEKGSGSGSSGDKRDKSEGEKQEERLESLLARRVFMMYMRVAELLCSGGSGGDNEEGDEDDRVADGRRQLQEMDVLSTVLDLCAIYGYSNGRLLRVLLALLSLSLPSTVTSKSSSSVSLLAEMRFRLTTSLMESIAQTHRQTEQIRQRVASLWTPQGGAKSKSSRDEEAYKQERQNAVRELIETGRYLYDLCFTMRILLEVFPLSALVLQYDHRMPLEKTVLGHVVLAYEVIVPILQETMETILGDDADDTAGLEDVVEKMHLYVHQTWYNTAQIGSVIIREIFVTRLNTWILGSDEEASDSGLKIDLVDRHVARVISDCEGLLSDALDTSKLVEQLRMYIHGVQSTKQHFPMMQHEVDDQMDTLELVFYNLITNSLAHVSSHASFSQSHNGTMSSFDLNKTRGSFLLDYYHMHDLSSTLHQWLKQRHTPLRESSMDEFFNVVRIVKQQLNIRIDAESDYMPTLASQQHPSKGKGSARLVAGKYDQECDSLKEMFPDFGRGFLYACLDVFQGDIATTTNNLLEDNLPKKLQDMDRTLEDIILVDEQPPAQPVSERTSMEPQRKPPASRITYNVRPSTKQFVPDDLSPVPWEHVNMFSQVHVGKKKDLKLGRLSEDLTKRILESYNYDDEYDDTYDDSANFDIESDMSDPYSKLKSQASGGIDGGDGGGRERLPPRQEQSIDKRRGRSAGKTSDNATSQQDGRPPRSGSGDKDEKSQRKGGSASGGSSGNAQSPQGSTSRPTASGNYRGKEKHKARVANHDRKKKAAKKNFAAMK